ncbi:hypothetical protein L596_013161 [Steinernema carpocapsae]|uniref:BTB domain-containing protein n=1 Tax=Steinernema carpocapsae TaxID=34508 RepID=A0A4U5NZA3_STECR|nr:hypothetical protein L596_013161 [Steinernema carpocapsae]
MRKLENLVARMERKTFVELIDSFYADLSDPKNPLIADPEDVANFKLDGEELYVPKKMLSAQSSFFAAYFKNHINKKEDSFYDVNGLKDVKVEDFVHFIGMIHSFAMHIDEKLVEGLLKLADLFQCKLILQRCVEYLKTAPVKCFSHRKKLQLAEKFKLRPILADIIDKASLEELKEGPWEGEISAFARSLMFLKLRMKYS